MCESRIAMARDAKAFWNGRYLDRVDDLPIPLPFFTDLAAGLAPGRALDLACGTGRHSMYLAERGWQVTAIDYSDVAISRIHHPNIRTIVADIEAPAFRVPNPPYHLILDTFFLHRPLLPEIAEALVPGGIAVLAFHLEGTYAIQVSELDEFYPDWKILHNREHTDIPTLERIYRKPTTR